ncbi:hypothetical protein AOLI_G00085020 [Acnodon oligacanthus]
MCRHVTQQVFWACSGNDRDALLLIMSCSGATVLLHKWHIIVLLPAEAPDPRAFLTHSNDSLTRQWSLTLSLANTNCIFYVIDGLVILCFHIFCKMSLHWQNV